MATQTIEFGFDAGSTISVKATPVGDISTVFTANTVTEVRGGLFRAAFVDQSLPVGIYRFEALEGSTVLGRSLVSITATSGTFREAVDALADVNSETIAADLIAAVDETGLKASSFTPEALDQLRAAEIDLSQWDPDTEPVKIYRGVDHLHATGNAFTFRNVAGNWPNLTGCTIRMELIIDGVTAIAGSGTIVTASGANQEFYIQVLRTAFDGSLIKDKTGVFRCVRIDGSGNRFPLANGVATLFPNASPAA